MKRLLLIIGTTILIAAIVLGVTLLTKGDMQPRDIPIKPAKTSKPPASSTPKATGTTITVAKSDFGDILWGPNRQAVYIWEREPSSTPECYDDCAAAWPPVLTTGEPNAGAGINAELLGTTSRKDGTTQVTYNGHPLYYYANEGPGEVECHNIWTHGGLWWVITPDGVRGA